MYSSCDQTSDLTSWRNNDVVVVSLFYKWVSGVTLALPHSSTILPLMPPSCAWFSLSIACYMCQEFLISPVVNLLRWCYCDYICWWPHKEYLQKTYRPHRCMDSLGIAVILFNHTNPHVAHIRVGFWYKRSFFYCVEF